MLHGAGATSFCFPSQNYWKGWHPPHLRRPCISLSPKILASVTPVPENETLSSSESKKGQPNVPKYRVSLNQRNFSVSMRTYWYMNSSLLSCVQLFCDPMNCSPSGSSVHGTSHARILEQVAISFSRGSSRPRDGTRLLHLLDWHADSLPLSHLGSPHTQYSSLKLMAEKHSPSYNHCAKPHSIRDVWEENPHRTDAQFCQNMKSLKVSRTQWRPLTTMSCLVLKVLM